MTRSVRVGRVWWLGVPSTWHPLFFFRSRLVVCPHDRQPPLRASSMCCWSRVAWPPHWFVALLWLLLVWRRVWLAPGLVRSRPFDWRRLRWTLSHTRTFLISAISLSAVPPLVPSPDVLSVAPLPLSCSYSWQCYGVVPGGSPHHSSSSRPCRPVGSKQGNDVLPQPGAPRPRRRVAVPGVCLILLLPIRRYQCDDPMSVDHAAVRFAEACVGSYRTRSARSHRCSWRSRVVSFRWHISHALNSLTDCRVLFSIMAGSVRFDATVNPTTRVPHAHRDRVNGPERLFFSDRHIDAM